MDAGHQRRRTTTPGGAKSFRSKGCGPAAATASLRLGWREPRPRPRRASLADPRRSQRAPSECCHGLLGALSCAGDLEPGSEPHPPNRSEGENRRSSCGTSGCRVRGFGAAGFLLRRILFPCDGGRPVEPASASGAVAADVHRIAVHCRSRDSQSDGRRSRPCAGSGGARRPFFLCGAADACNNTLSETAARAGVARTSQFLLDDFALRPPLSFLADRSGPKPAGCA